MFVVGLIGVIIVPVVCLISSSIFITTIVYMEIRKEHSKNTVN